MLNQYEEETLAECRSHCTWVKCKLNSLPGVHYYDPESAESLENAVDSFNKLQQGELSYFLPISLKPKESELIKWNTLLKYMQPENNKLIAALIVLKCPLSVMFGVLLALKS